MKKLLLLSVFLISLVSCTFEKQEALTPGCDATIFYETEIKPILDAKCLTCHSTAPTYMSGPDLSSYELLKAKVNEVRDHVFVRKDMPMAGFPEMTEAELAKLRCWLDQGARNN